jgi:hypothetical protein
MSGNTALIVVAAIAFGAAPAWAQLVKIDPDPSTSCQKNFRSSVTRPA